MYRSSSSANNNPPRIPIGYEKTVSSIKWYTIQELETVRLWESCRWRRRPGSSFTQTTKTSYLLDLRVEHGHSREHILLGERACLRRNGWFDECRRLIESSDILRTQPNLRRRNVALCLGQRTRLPRRVRRE